MNKVFFKDNREVLAKNALNKARILYRIKLISSDNRVINKKRIGRSRKGKIELYVINFKY